MWLPKFEMLLLGFLDCRNVEAPLKEKRIADESFHLRLMEGLREKRSVLANVPNCFVSLQNGFSNAFWGTQLVQLAFEVMPDVVL